jgi:hypothetical protein
MNIPFVFPGQRDYVAKAAESIPHTPGDVARAGAVEGLGILAEAIGQAGRRVDPAEARAIIEAALPALNPIRIALKAAELMLADYLPEAR